MAHKVIRIDRHIANSWHVHFDKKMIAGFWDKDDAVLFVETKWPEAEKDKVLFGMYYLSID